MQLTGWFRHFLFDVLGPILSRSSVKRMKRKQLKNKEIEPCDGYVKENQVAPEEDKIAVADTPQDDMKVVNVADKEVNIKGMDKVTMFIDKAFSEDRRRMEWHVAVNIIDNFFFVMFIITIVISSLIILIPKTGS